MSPDTNGHPPKPDAPPAPARARPAQPPRRVPVIDLVLTGALRLGAPVSPAK
jgi:hypothetical protein